MASVRQAARQTQQNPSCPVQRDMPSEPSSTPDARRPSPYAFHTGMPDELAVAADGTLVGGGPGGVYLFAPDGTFQERVDLAPVASNVAFGQDGRALFAAAGDRVVRFELG